MSLTLVLGYQALERLAQELRASIAEQELRLGVHELDLCVRTHNDDGVGRSVEQLRRALLRMDELLPKREGLLLFVLLRRHALGDVFHAVNDVLHRGIAREHRGVVREDPALLVVAAVSCAGSPSVAPNPHAVRTSLFERSRKRGA